MPTPKRFQILSIDGGGLKGLFPAAILAEWEKETGRPIWSSFDLIAGTSTGGLIALALGLGFTAEEVCGLYSKNAEEIFPGSSTQPSALGRLVRSCPLFRREMYRQKHSSDGLRNVLSRLIGDQKLGRSKTRLVIPAYSPLFEKNIHIFKTAHHERLKSDFKIDARDVALATSAAPTYLDPFRNEQGYELLDGGLWANNPVALAVVEALGYLQQKSENVHVLRIGTTREIRPTANIKTAGGQARMAPHIVRFMMEGQSQSASGMAVHLLSREQVYEIDPNAGAGDYELDRYSPKLIAHAVSEWRHASSNLSDKGYLGHKAAPFTPCHQLID